MDKYHKRNINEIMHLHINENSNAIQLITYLKDQEEANKIALEYEKDL